MKPVVHKSKQGQVELSLETRFNTYKVLRWDRGKIVTDKRGIMTEHKAKSIFANEIACLDNE